TYGGKVDKHVGSLKTQIHFKHDAQFTFTYAVIRPAHAGYCRADIECIVELVAHAIPQRPNRAGAIAFLCIQPRTEEKALFPYRLVAAMKDMGEVQRGKHFKV